MGGVALWRTLSRPGPLPVVTYPGILSAQHAPTILLNAGLTDPAVDIPFLLVLHNLMGLDVVSFITDPTEFAAYEPRFASIFSAARSMGMKIHIINQLDNASSYQVTGLTPPFASTPTLQQFGQFEVDAMARYAAYRPDYLSCLAEFQLLNSKLHAAFTPADFARLVAYLTATVKQASPGTQTWVDIIPYDKIDAQAAQYLVSDPNLDGIGGDIYNEQQKFGSYANGFNLINQAGKKGGITETWRYAKYYNQQYNDPKYAQDEANWLLPGGVYTSASLWNATAIFSPFFSNLFMTLEPFPYPFTSQNILDASRRLLANTNNILAGTQQLTIIGQAYMQTIAAVKALQPYQV